MMNYQGHRSDNCFWYILLNLYIPVSALDSACNHPGVSIWQGGLSFHFPDEISMVVICPSRFYKNFLQHLHKYILLFIWVQTCLNIFMWWNHNQNPSHTLAWSRHLEYCSTKSHLITFNKFCNLPLLHVRRPNTH